MVLHELKLFLEFLGKKAILKSILEDLNYEKPDFEEWYNKIQIAGAPRWPDTELDRIKLCLVFLKHCVDSGRANEHIKIGFNVNGKVKNDYDVNTNIFLDQYFAPLYEYIVNTIEEQSLVLYLLLKFKKRTEWFSRTELFREYTAYRGKREDVLNKKLRQFLFDQGIENPFSEPLSPSGKIDIVAGLEL
jgi:hypothetical protein